MEKQQAASLLSASEARGKNCTLSITADILPTDPAGSPAADATYRSVSDLAKQPMFANRPDFRVHAHRRLNQSELDQFFQARCGRRPIGTCGPAMDCGYLQTDVIQQSLMPFHACLVLFTLATERTLLRVMVYVTLIGSGLCGMRSHVEDYHRTGWTSRRPEIAVCKSPRGLVTTCL